MRVAIGLFLLAAALGVAEAGETGWRSDGTGRYPDAKPPVTFDPEEGVVWATPLPSWSNASPVVVEDRIFLCAEPDTQVARGTVENRLRSTPVFEGTRVYVRAPEHLYCFGE